MFNSDFAYRDGDIDLKGFIAYDDSNQNKRPAVLIAPDWTGRNQFSCDKARQLADLGYVGFAIDMYGNARLGADNDQKAALMTPLVEDRVKLRQRIGAAFDAVRELPQVDETKVIAIGYCFGGLCVLDLARDGVDVKGVVSFHGLLSKPEALENKAMTAKVLVLHGYADPMVAPEQVNQFCDEMTASNIDWQVHMYGNTLHAFTNPLANDPNFGTVYSQTADERSWQATLGFIAELV